jgi:threonine/homoserine/homoserine lactone efflux protein
MVTPMNPPVSQLLETGFVLGWSVAWPPGPITAEIARRCIARGFWAGFGVLLGACSADALWAVLVALGIGMVFAGAVARAVMGTISVALLLTLAALFLRGAWRSLGAPPSAEPAALRFEGSRASFLLGAGMSLSSPWNVAFWLATVGRPEMTRFGTIGLLVMAAGVILGALSWGLIWSGSVVLLHRRIGAGSSGRFWGAGAQAATAALMLYFAVASTLRLLRG